MARFCDAVDLALSCINVATDNVNVLKEGNKQVIADALRKLQDAVEKGTQTVVELVEIPNFRWLVALNRYCQMLNDASLQVLFTHLQRQLSKTLISPCFRLKQHLVD